MNLRSLPSSITGPKPVMDVDRRAEIDAAYDAFQAYATAKRKADATLTFIACHDAAQAWVKFINLYLPTEQKLPEVPA